MPPWNDIWEMSAEIPYWLYVTTQIRVVLLIGWGKFLANQMHHPDLWSVASSVQNWWRCKISAVFSLDYDRLKQGHDNNNKMEPFLVKLTNYISLDLINLLASPFYLF